MENVYACTCGNQTWIIRDNEVQCTACKATFQSLHTSVKEFNHMIADQIEELEDTAP